MNYYKGVTYYLELTLLNNQGEHVSGKTVTYEVYKSATDVLFTSGTLTEIGVTGVYKDDIIFTESIQYRVEYTTPKKFNNVIETFIIDEVSLGVIHGKICKILGLSQSNYRLTDQVYNSEGCLTSAKISIYDNASDTNSQTNPIAEYTVNATYNANDELTDYKVTEI